MSILPFNKKGRQGNLQSAKRPADYLADEIDRLKREGSLHVVEPLLPGSPMPRVILATTCVHDAINVELNDDAHEKRMAKLRADLERFVKGQNIIVGARLHGGCFLKRLEPAEAAVWEIISRNPKPSYRVFGRFARKDVFVATMVIERTLLGEFMSRLWRREIRRCKADWSRLFPANVPLLGDDINDYISPPFTDERDI